jgi:uncharacterized phiE125 gp8 family phage protein
MHAQMYLEMVTAPASTIVTLAEAKAHLRVQHNAEDAVITAFIGAATALIDGPSGFLRRALVTQTWRLVMPESPAEYYQELPLPPFAEMESIKYFDSDDAEQTLDAALYRVQAPTFSTAFVELKPGVAWPASYDRRDAYKFEFTAGYGNPADVPIQIRQAALLIVGTMYARRGDEDDGRNPMTPAVQRLLSPYAWREFA